MKLLLSTLALIVAAVSAQERCDGANPTTFCNTTEILAFQTSECRPYHIFLVRGSDEPYPGRQGNLTREICSRIGSKDCGFENIEYPAKSASWGKEEWCKSAAKGATNGQAQMKDYHQKCPESKLILLGYSQGGAVAQNILSGGGGKVFECELAPNPALDTSIGSNIIAAVAFGAVIRSRNQNFTIGDGINFDGQRARTPDELAALYQYSGRFREYCHFGDPMCAVGSTPVSIISHLNYFLEHNEEVADWVVGKATASNEKSSPSTDSLAESSASPSATSSSLASATQSATNNPVARPIQSGAAGTGAASMLKVSLGYTSLVVLIGMTFVLTI